MKTSLFGCWTFLVLLFVKSTRCNIFAGLGATSCPCSNSTWCNPVTDAGTPEVFAFSVRNDESHWRLYDWSKLTTVVMFGYINDSLMCLAHSHNVRVVVLGSIDRATFMDPAKRQSWIQQQFVLVKTHFLDGLNFDFEDVIAEDNQSVRDAYTALVQETSSYFKQQMPHCQISVDVAWKPNVDVRFYDYQGLAENSDLLFVMAYDEQSQIFGECVAGPNSAVTAAIDGLTAYINGSSHIAPGKLVLGLPWYGYIYPCVKTEGNKCYIQEVPFRGVNCSDAAGRQYDYGFIYILLQTLTGGYQWNATSATPYITYENTINNQSYQIQFDDPESLKIKYELASRMGLQGVGMWNIDALDYSDSAVGKNIREKMFSALPSRITRKTSTSVSARSGKTCPCSKAEWCLPVTNMTRKEVYAFSIVNDENHWKRFDWSKISTVCMYGYVNTSLMCLAHSHGARAVVLGEVKEITMITPVLRSQWVSEQLQLVQENFLDGLNFDVELTITPEQKDLSEAYTALVTETYAAFKKALPYSQISVDVIHDAFSQYCAYDYPGLAAASDFLFIMAYDESGYDHVGPNADFSITSQGIDSYIRKNISASKLVLGLPWYGYIYNCTKLQGDNCFLNSSLDPHHRQAEQFGYKTIYQLLQTMPERYKWNATSETPYFSFPIPGTDKGNQVQYDDPKSLKLKYDLAARKDIRGVGMWTVDFLDYSDTQEGDTMRQSMFSILPSHDD
ncbi:hypothetical protein BsWGS_28451 [Bradybaena similaris]